MIAIYRRDRPEVTDEIFIGGSQSRILVCTEANEAMNCDLLVSGDPSLSDRAQNQE